MFSHEIHECLKGYALEGNFERSLPYEVYFTKFSCRAPRKKNQVKERSRLKGCSEKLNELCRMSYVHSDETRRWEIIKN